MNDRWKIKFACNLNAAPPINFNHIWVRLGSVVQFMSGSSIKLTNCFLFPSNWGKFDDFNNGPKKSEELLCACHNHNHKRRAYILHLTSSKQKKADLECFFFSAHDADFTVSSYYGIFRFPCMSNTFEAHMKNSLRLFIQLSGVRKTEHTKAT